MCRLSGQIYRYVKRDSKGIVVYRSGVLSKSYIRLVFDISDTGGRKSELTWSLAGDNLEQIMEKYLKSHKQKDPASTIRAGIDSALKTIFGY